MKPGQKNCESTSSPTKNSTENKLKETQLPEPAVPEAGAAEGPSDSEIEKLGKVVDRGHSDPNLIGDFTHSYLLPILPSADAVHKDLKEITSTTLGSLIQGDYKSQINSFTIIDCRYPYEFEGGHIAGALNLFTEKQVWDKFMGGKIAKIDENENKEGAGEIGSIGTKRDIIIFHCEFSKERGPKMCRTLRSWDRTLHTTSFPNLHYPELYLLSRGYKKFFSHHPELCTPSSYLPMDSEAHKSDYILWRKKTKDEQISNKIIGGVTSHRDIKKRRMPLTDRTGSEDGTQSPSAKVTMSVKKCLL